MDDCEHMSEISNEDVSENNRKLHPEDTDIKNADNLESNKELLAEEHSVEQSSSKRNIISCNVTCSEEEIPITELDSSLNTIDNDGKTVSSAAAFCLHSNENSTISTVAEAEPAPNDSIPYEVEEKETIHVEKGEALLYEREDVTIHKEVTVEDMAGVCEERKANSVSRMVGVGDEDNEVGGEERTEVEEGLVDEKSLEVGLDNASHTHNSMPDNEDLPMRMDERSLEVGLDNTSHTHNSMPDNEDLPMRMDERSLEVGLDNASHTHNSMPDNEDLPMRCMLSDNLHLVAEARKDFNSSNYFRGCKWAPDGSCILTCNEDNKMRLYNLPAQLYSPPPHAEECCRDTLELSPALMVTARESIYDYCWYPRMNSWEPQTCCFLSSCKDHPIHLWDAFTGENRASYVPFNHLDEVISSYSLSFSLDGERIFAGIHKGLRIFHLSRPGRECRTLSTYSKKSGGQRGIISCIAQCPTIPRTYALGSYSQSVGVYSEDMKSACMTLTSLDSGVTHLMFSQTDGNILYCGFRKIGLIVGWDLRSPGSILHSMQRVVDTNQRIYFDLASGGDFIVSGSTTGYVYGWNTESRNANEFPSTGYSRSDSLEPTLYHLAHSDAVNGVSIHPNLPILASCSGQRHYQLPGNYSDDEMEEENDTNSSSDISQASSPNSLRLWHYGK